MLGLPSCSTQDGQLRGEDNTAHSELDPPTSIQLCDAGGGQKRVSGYQELELEVVVNHQTWMQATELRSSRGAASASDH